MSRKIFNSFLCKNLKASKHFLLSTPKRLFVKNPLFTKNGDTGKCFTYIGQMYKDHKIFQAIGVTEELNAQIGLAREFVIEDERLKPVADKLLKIQLVLVDIIDVVNSLPFDESDADKEKTPTPLADVKVCTKDIADLEFLITHYGNFLPKPEKMIIPGGGKASAALQISVTVCRRCERTLVSVLKDVNSTELILTYINRLSTYLFQASRIAAKFANRTEIIYKPRKKEEIATSDK